MTVVLFDGFAVSGGPSITKSLPRPQGDGMVEFLVTSYMLGAPDGSNLGAAGYSHEFVARLFRPLLEQWGPVTDIKDARRDLDLAVAACRARGTTPVHFSVLPLQDVHFAKDAINIVMPAWEFPDVPDHAFDNNPQNNWPEAAQKADMLMVSGPFTESALVRGGTKTPMAIVPVPTPDTYFQVPMWSPEQSVKLNHRAFYFRGQGDSRAPMFNPPPAKDQTFKRRFEKRLSKVVQGVVGRRRYDKLSAALRRTHRPLTSRPDFSSLTYPRVESLDLSGIVYTSIFNPIDGRKNWIDMLNAFLIGLGDRPDVTLVFKLIARTPCTVRHVIDYYLHRNLPHRCAVAFVCDYLSDAEMVDLCRGSTFYFQASKAEGNCLPLMNFLAAGRPAVSPDHSSMSDYLRRDCGFVVDSHPEPAAWPHDSRLRLRTTWGRIVWPSLRDQLADSYRVVTEAPGEYQAMSHRARLHMRRWASYSAVEKRLDAAIADVLGRVTQAPHQPATEHPLASVRAAA